MSTTEYRLGPKPMDVAAKLPSGWVRLANARRLTDKDVEGWKPLVVAEHPQSPLQERYDALVTLNSELGIELDKSREQLRTTEANRHRATNQLVHYRSLSERLQRQLDGDEPRTQPKRLTPTEMKWQLLLTFLNHGEMTVREAAGEAGLLLMPNWTTRFATDLVKLEWIESTGKHGHAHRYRITAGGRDELKRIGAQES